MDIDLSDGRRPTPALRGKTVQATFDIKDVKTLRLPELTHEFLHNFGVHSPEQLRELIRVLLERRLEYHAAAVGPRAGAGADRGRRAAGSCRRTCWCARRARPWPAASWKCSADGMSEEEIRGRQRLLQQDVLQSTALALKEHFVLQKIAEVEKIDVDEDDIDDEIERMADQSDESPRRVRARLEKEDLLDALAAEMIERKALDLILDSAEYEDVPIGEPAEQRRWPRSKSRPCPARCRTRPRRRRKQKPEDAAPTGERRS